VDFIHGVFDYFFLGSPLAGGWLAVACIAVTVGERPVEWWGLG
jgi:hypothetical protein